jgi:predicted ATPase
MVIIEQPELHLHPKAQSALAEIVASSVSRGVQVIVETHSSLFLLGLQTAVAKGALQSEHVRLNWFSTSDAGHTRIRAGTVDERGSISGWPSDFMDVRLDAEAEFLEAVEQNLAAGDN